LASPIPRQRCLPSPTRRQRLFPPPAASSAPLPLATALRCSALHYHHPPPPREPQSLQAPHSTPERAEPSATGPSRQTGHIITTTIFSSFTTTSTTATTPRLGLCLTSPHLASPRLAAIRSTFHAARRPPLPGPGVRRPHRSLSLSLSFSAAYSRGSGILVVSAAGIQVRASGVFLAVCLPPRACCRLATTHSGSSPPRRAGKRASLPSGIPTPVAPAPAPRTHRANRSLDALHYPRHHLRARVCLAHRYHHPAAQR